MDQATAKRLMRIAQAGWVGMSITFLWLGVNNYRRDGITIMTFLLLAAGVAAAFAARERMIQLRPPERRG